MYTGKTRSFKVTPGKLEELQERLVEMRGTPAKSGEAPEKRGEPKLVLIAEPDIIHHVAQTFDDVEGINADPGVREVLSGDRDKTVLLNNLVTKRREAL